MLKFRIIPKLQVIFKDSPRGSRPILVITRRFTQPRIVGDPLSQSRIFESQLVDEIALLSVRPSLATRTAFLQLTESFARTLATPLLIGGGLRSISDITAAIDHGADKVSLNTAAIDCPSLISDTANIYGSQSVVVSVDCVKYDSVYWVARKGTQDSVTLQAWLREVALRGAGEILLTSINYDGMSAGLDIELLAEATQTTSLPIIISGGCGLASHLSTAYSAGASAVAAGTIFFRKDQNPLQCRSHVQNAGHCLRPAYR